LAARARAARYAALAEAAAAAGLVDLLLGHHARDQAETLLIRQAAHSGPAGLSGMAAVSETPGLRLVRPLLAADPERLRATLLAQGIGWAEDPSNADPRAARTAARARLGCAALGCAALALRLAEDAARAGQCRAAAEGGIAATLAARATLFPEGHALLTPGPIAPDCLAALLRAVAGAPYPAGGTALARLAADPAPATLGGVRLMPAGRLGPGLLVVREAAAMRAAIPAGDGALWDGRFRLCAEGGLPAGATLGALADDAPLLRRHTDLPSAVLRTLPALRTREGGLAVPPLGYFSGWTNRRVRLTLCPPNPAAGAPFRAAGLGDAQRASAPHVPG
jgi:tRNA(Ile)-lysidine synthase